MQEDVGILGVVSRAPGVPMSGFSRNMRRDAGAEEVIVVAVGATEGEVGALRRKRPGRRAPGLLGARRGGGAA